MKRFFRYVSKTVKWFFIVFLLFLGSLFFREQRLPRFCIDKATERLSTTNFVVSCQSASYGFRRGLTLKGVCAHDLTRANRLTPVVEAQSVNVNPRTRTVRIIGAKYARLPDSYYSTECRERNERVEVELPSVRRFQLILERPEVLGVKPAQVSAQVAVRGGRVTLDKIHLDWWPQSGRQMALDGNWRIDFNTQKVTGEVHGLATQPLVRPLIEALDITSALPYIDAFTGVSEPIPAQGDFAIDMMRGDFDMRLTLSPKTPTYRGAPFRQADGTLGVHTEIRGTNCNVRLTVDLPAATDANGRTLSGRIGVTNIDGVARLAYDVRSSIDFAEALKVADFLTADDLSMIACHTPPVLTVKGVSGTSVDDLAYNDIDFTARVEKSTFLGLRLNNVVARFRLKGDVLDFYEATAEGSTGGRISAPGVLRIPRFDGDRAEFATKITYTGGSLQEMSEFFKFDLGERCGRVDGWCELAAPATTNFVSRLNGQGHVEITDGYLAQIKLFAGLTQILADKVPGVGFLVNQSQASADFTLTNGVFRSDNVYIEGGVVSLKGWGSYDIAHDNLDFDVRVQFVKKESLLGKILHPVTFPFTKLLLEFKATGPIDEPKWNYISIIDRIL
ncbi:MAG: AsmA-like C-terminal region-containing protein [Kiritimatiellia bacterium]